MYLVISGENAFDRLCSCRWSLAREVFLLRRDALEVERGRERGNVTTSDAPLSDNCHNIERAGQCRAQAVVLHLQPACPPCPSSLAPLRFARLASLVSAPPPPGALRTVTTRHDNICSSCSRCPDVRPCSTSLSTTRTRPHLRSSSWPTLAPASAFRSLRRGGSCESSFLFPSAPRLSSSTRRKQGTAA
jgi:hypothetical protein